MTKMCHRTVPAYPGADGGEKGRADAGGRRKEIEIIGEKMLIFATKYCMIEWIMWSNVYFRESDTAVSQYLHRKRS